MNKIQNQSEFKMRHSIEQHAFSTQQSKLVSQKLARQGFRFDLFLKKNKLRGRRRMSSLQVKHYDKEGVDFLIFTL